MPPSHRRLQVAGSHGLLGRGVAHHDVGETLLQVGKVAREQRIAMTSEATRCRPFCRGKPLAGPPAHSHVAQRAVVDIDDPGTVTRRTSSERMPWWTWLSSSAASRL